VNHAFLVVASTRFSTVSGVYDLFAEKLANRVAQLTVGRGTEAGVLIGPLIDEAAVQKVSDLLDDAVAKGGRILLGGSQHPLGGLFFEPTVLTEARDNMRLSREEIFGPVAPLFKFDTEDEAIAMANNTEFGLASYFYTNSSQRAWRVVEALEYGMVGHNTGAISNEVSPFGGIKQSGLGREGSRHGIEEYLELKYWCSALR